MKTICKRIYFFKTAILGLAWASLLFKTDLESFEIKEQSFAYKLKAGTDPRVNGEHLLMQQFFRTNDTVFDVGANRGEWSLLALQTNFEIRIFAFEPIPEIFQKMKNHFLSFDNLDAFNLALSDETGEGNFYFYSNLSELSGLFDRETLRKQFRPPNLITVPLDTLDRFCAEHNVQKIDFLKIDTEGAEWKVLNGAKGLLQGHQIRAIQFEYGGTYIDANTTLEQVMRLLTKNDYVIFKIVPSGLIHISHWDPRLEDYDYSNYFAIFQKDMNSYSLVEFPTR